MEQKEYTVVGINKKLWHPLFTHKKIKKNQSPIKASNYYISEQIKLHSNWLKLQNFWRPAISDAFIQKRKLWIGSLLPSWSLFKSPLHIQTQYWDFLTTPILLTMYRNFNLFPFQPIEKTNFKFSPIDLFGLVLRSTHSMLNTIALKTFLTSAIKVLTWLLATTTKICTNAWSKQDHSLSSSYQKKIYIYMHHTSLHNE